MERQRNNVAVNAFEEAYLQLSDEEAERMKRFFFTFLKTELKLSLRDMNMVIFAVIMPLVIIFIILGIIYGPKPAYDGADYTFLEQSSELSVRLLFAQAD